MSTPEYSLDYAWDACLGTLILASVGGVVCYICSRYLFTRSFAAIAAYLLFVASIVPSAYLSITLETEVHHLELWFQSGMSAWKQLVHTMGNVTLGGEHWKGSDSVYDIQGITSIRTTIVNDLDHYRIEVDKQDIQGYLSLAHHICLTYSKTAVITALFAIVAMFFVVKRRVRRPKCEFLCRELFFTALIVVFGVTSVVLWGVSDDGTGHIIRSNIETSESAQIYLDYYTECTPESRDRIELANETKDGIDALNRILLFVKSDTSLRRLACFENASTCESLVSANDQFIAFATGNNETQDLAFNMQDAAPALIQSYAAEYGSCSMLGSIDHTLMCMSILIAIAMWSILLLCMSDVVHVLVRSRDVRV